MKKIVLALLAVCLASSAANAAVMRLSTSDVDENASNSLNLVLNQSASMFVWVSTSAGQQISGLSLDITSSDATVLEATAHTISNPGTRWFGTGGGVLGDLVDDSNAFVFNADQTGINTGDENVFVLHSEIQFQATALGTTNLAITRGAFDITEGLANNTIGDENITFGTGSVTVAVPEPGAITLLSLGLGAVVTRYRRRRA